MPNGELAISLRDGDKTPSQLAFAPVLQPPLCFTAVFSRFWLFALFVFPGIVLFPGMAVLSLRGMYCRGGTGRIVVTWYAVVSISTLCRQLNFLSDTTMFPSLGTLEPRDIGTPSAQRGERAPTRATVFFFQVHLWQSLAVSPLRVSLPSRSWRLRRPGWCTLVAGTAFGLLFPETLRGGPVRGFPGFRRRLSICLWKVSHS